MVARSMVLPASVGTAEVLETLIVQDVDNKEFANVDNLPAELDLMALVPSWLITMNTTSQ